MLSDVLGAVYAELHGKLQALAGIEPLIVSASEKFVRQRK